MESSQFTYCFSFLFFSFSCSLCSMGVSWNLTAYQQSRYKLPSCLQTFSSKRITVTYQTHHHSSNFSFSPDFVFSVTSLLPLCHPSAISLYQSSFPVTNNNHASQTFLP